MSDVDPFPPGAMDRMLETVGRPGGRLADARLLHLVVEQNVAITPDYHRITLSGEGVADLQFRTGQDLMMRIPSDADAVTNRRYTIRRLDRSAGTVDVDMVVHGDGPGARWADGAARGDALDAIGPRGSVFIDDDADWHLFVGDETALPGMCAMAEVLPAGVPASVLVELPARAEGLGPDLGPASAVEVRWLERGDDEPGGAERLVAAASEITLPSSGTGHAYVAGEMKVVRAVTAALQARGLAREQISPKAYWRLDSANAPHGEPLDPDRLTGPTRPL